MILLVFESASRGYAQQKAKIQSKWRYRMDTKQNNLHLS